METTKWPIYQMVEQEADEAFKIHMDDTWNNMNQVAWETLRDLLPKIAELENEQTKRSMQSNECNESWISVYERLPSSYETVLTYSPELGYREGEWLEIELSWFTNMWTQRLKWITHWMPLPPKPTTNK